MTDREAMKMALEALENLTTYDFKPSNIFKYFYPTAKGDYVDLREFKEKTKPAITALRQALAQPEQSKYSDIVSDGGLDPRNKFDAQPEQAVVPFPSFMRKRIEQAMEDAIHPKGMSVHDGKAKVLVSDLHRMLLVIDSVLAQPEPVVSFTDNEEGLWIQLACNGSYYSQNLSESKTAKFFVNAYRGRK